MRILIRQFRPEVDREASQDRWLDADTLRIGRGTDQDLQLADLRVALAHAEISRNGKHLMLRTRGKHRVWCNGTPVQECLLGAGDEIDIGRYRLQVVLAAGADLAVEFHERASAGEDRAARQARLRLSLHQGLSMRGLALGCFVLVLTLSLLLPLALRHGVGGTASAAPAAFTDAAWTPGPGSTAHAWFSQDCSRCHAAPFEKVADSACVDCHRDQGTHVADATVQAHPAFAGQRCTDCHREHAGNQQLIVSHPGLCADCHAQPERRFPDLKMVGAADFGHAHPQFSPRVARYDAAAGRFRFEAQRQGSEALREDTGLKFSHAQHLAKSGMDGPEGRRVLACGDCHQPDSQGVHFEPVRMEQHCASCHRLDFDPQAPERVLPHGKPQEIQQAVRDYYAGRALQGDAAVAAPTASSERRRPGEAPVTAGGAPAGPRAWAEARAQQTLSDLFERRTCHYCHEVERRDEAGLPWAIRPVNLEEHAYANARFNHGAHRSEPCSSCHAAPDSQRSADVLLPELSRCRDCHGGVDSRDAVPSACGLCHAYHVAAVRQPVAAQPSPAAAPAGEPTP